MLRVGPGKDVVARVSDSAGPSLSKQLAHVKMQAPFQLKAYASARPEWRDGEIAFAIT
jgi:hypothetical protein